MNYRHGLLALVLSIPFLEVCACHLMLGVPKKSRESVKEMSDGRKLS